MRTLVLVLDDDAEADLALLEERCRHLDAGDLFALALGMMADGVRGQHEEAREFAREQLELAIWGRR